MKPSAYYMSGYFSTNAKRLCAALLLSLLAIAATADVVQIKADHPDRYIVQEGDTLWGIAGRFLEKPWDWPEIWDINQQIQNPHLIFPGDELTLLWVDGKPVLRVSRGRVASTIKLSPYVRKTPVDNAIATIPLDAVRPFLQSYRLVERKQLKQAAYIVGGAEQRVLIGNGSKFYARGDFDSTQKHYSVFREGKFYKHPRTKEKLGVQVTQIGEVTQLASGDEVGTFYVDKASTGLLKGDYLLPAEDAGFQAFFQPRPADAGLQAMIMDVERGVRNVGVLDVVLLDVGEREGVAPGHVFSVMKVGERVRDDIKGKWLDLPPEESGTVMVFKAFDKISYGLILSAQQPLSIGDALVSPN